MSITKHIAKHIREVYFGGNWTISNLKDNLKDVTWEEATTQVYALNTIATLVYHINYYVIGQTKFFQGGPLETKDKFSFDHPPINSQEDWDNFLNTVWKDVELYAKLIEQMSDDKLESTFVDEKYGVYYRNLRGVVEHTHYHLGQIALVKKVIRGMVGKG